MPGIGEADSAFLEEKVGPTDQLMKGIEVTAGPFDVLQPPVALPTASTVTSSLLGTSSSAITEPPRSVAPRRATNPSNAQDHLDA